MFGIDALKRLIDRRLDTLESLVRQTVTNARFTSLVDAFNQQTSTLVAIQRVLADLKQGVQNMPTQADLDQAIQNVLDAVTAETQQVTTQIQDLKNQIANGQPVTQEQLDRLNQTVVNAVKNIDPDDLPSPGGKKH